MRVLASTVDDFLIKILTCDVKFVHLLVLKLSDLTTCAVQIQPFLLSGNVTCPVVTFIAFVVVCC